MAMNTYLSTVTSNAYGLSAPIKRYTVTEWITKQDPYTCCLQEAHFISKDTHRLEVKGWKKIFHENGNNNKKPEVAILVSDKIDFKTKVIK